MEEAYVSLFETGKDYDYSMNLGCDEPDGECYITILGTGSLRNDGSRTIRFRDNYNGSEWEVESRIEMDITSSRVFVNEVVDFCVINRAEAGDAMHEWVEGWKQ